ncbi:hypothetical protein LTR47_009964 [Exophiala xenobiotica]|nr:hypothetical protein LTR47_009964 [Exophiala xenobiotica]KAK5284284.1 hypothetical protein LTR40_000562 [Exophiala xenobiotica]KAK5359219.1 hypothetical protein LTR11_010647 [Exophiala xenobiotica]KAK5361028.1 hypothetical protein LTS03_010464 [Exophiala xenobiotica]
MNQLVAFVQPLNVPFPPLRPAGGDPPPVMPTSTNEVEEEEEEEEDDDDHNADNDVTDVNKAAQQSNPGVDDRGCETQKNARRKSGQIQQTPPRLCGSAPRQSVEARKVRRKERKKEKRTKAKQGHQ